MAVPGIVMGVALFLVYARPPFVLYGTLWILLLGFITMELLCQLPAGPVRPHRPACGARGGRTHLRRLPPARACGRSPPRCSARTIVATWCIVFIGVIRELSATVLLTTSNTKVIAVVIYDLNESGDLGAISVLGIALLLVSFAIIALVNRLSELSARNLEAA